jgi:hypothetical protein
MEHPKNCRRNTDSRPHDRSSERGQTEHPTSNIRCNEYARRVIEALKSVRPLALFDEPTFAPIIQVNADDPRMVAAVAEARQRWPEFMAAFQARKSADQVLAIKARCAEGEEEEFM